VKLPGVVAALGVILAASLPCAAQDAGTVVSPQTCDQKDATAKQGWAAEPHAWLASVFHKEQRDIADSWCRIWETTDPRDRSFKAENFGRTLFTGDGLHPAVASSLVAGSGLAGGATFSVDRALASRPVRLSVSADAMAATNGSWQTGAGVAFLGSARRSTNDHIRATVDFYHQHLAELSYFGPSNDSVATDETAFALEKTVVGGAIAVPVGGGLTVSFTGAGAWFTPGNPGDASVQPVSARFVESTTPAVTADTSYFVSGAGLNWRYPVDAISEGYRTSAGATYYNFHEASGQPYSFGRLDLQWANSYLADSAIGTFTAAAYSTLTFVGDGDAVPFYLQPTVGGTDLFGRSLLRSYHDYRFRDPNLVGLVIEHERTFKDFFGTLLFVDFGQVSDAPSHLRLDAFHVSYGAGVTLRAGNTTVLRMFFAWGGGEGTRTTFTGSSKVFGDQSVSVKNW
jgi:hypothetical protein